LLLAYLLTGNCEEMSIMSKSFRIVLAVFALAASGAADAAYIDLGAMGPPGVRLFGNDFSTVGDFSDQYTFSLSGPADSFGFTLALDGSWVRDIDITGVGLSSDGTLGSAVWATNTDIFSFSSLLAGSYSLFVNGTVTGRNGGLLGGGLVGYAGTLITTAATPSKSVPEPGTLGLMGLSLLAMFFFSRRRRAR
jgi:hypothetical protein